MSAERVAIIPACAGCGARWLPADPARWRLVRINAGLVPRLIFLCRCCSEIGPERWPEDEAR